MWKQMIGLLLAVVLGVGGAWLFTSSGLLAPGEDKHALPLPQAGILPCNQRMEWSIWLISGVRSWCCILVIPPARIFAPPQWLP